MCVLLNNEITFLYMHKKINILLFYFLVLIVSSVILSKILCEIKI